ncbi:MAG: ComEC/Rec2 family competence protein [Candidatus Colwellbacteria bacterium]|nr:ComEC/Rec2 family competence protein [Candidatus Colwellbacteria bacterium]
MPLFDKAFYFPLFFILGVGAAGFGIRIWLSLIFAAIVGYFIFSFRPKRVLVFVLICFAGYFYHDLYVVLRSHSVPLGEERVYVGLVVDQPEFGLKTTLLDIALQKPNEGMLRVYSSSTENIQYGDIISFQGVVEEQTAETYTVAFPQSITVLERQRGNPVKSILFSIKTKIIDNLQAVLAPEKSALMAGILLGERAEFTPELKEAMRLSGTTHIVALSGYNIAILVTTLSLALAYICDRRKAFWLSLMVIPLFVVMTGAEASVVRAGIMGLVTLLAVQQERIYSPRNAITLTALAMLIYDPRLLSRDVGFQLSFAALLGMVYFYPWMMQKLKWRSGGFLNWRTNALQTLSAQIAVLPILLPTFGFVAPTALFANILILEFVPLTMLAGFFTALSGFLSYYLSIFIGWGTNLLLSYEIFIIQLFALNWA